MSILIKGMAMPTNCGECPFIGLGYDQLVCRLQDCVLCTKAKTTCPLIELPPHGDLIDRDALKISLLGEEYGTNFPTVFNQIIKVVNSVPVVVESEEE